VTQPLPPLLSVVVLAFNEVANLEAAVQEIADELQRLAVDHELLLVDDGSTDGTGALADALCQQLAQTRVIHHSHNLGLGGGYRTGFSQARGRFVTFFPADGQFPATIIGQFLPDMDHCDMVLGYLPERRSSLIAKGLSYVERLLYRALFGAMPTFQGIMMFRRSLLDDLPLHSQGRGWAVQMELILRAARGPYRIQSVPTTLRPRQSGASKVNNLRTIASNLRQVIALSRQIARS